MPSRTYVFVLLCHHLCEKPEIFFEGGEELGY